jgi:phosphoserine phosphatase
MKFMVDIDGTICHSPSSDYRESTPIQERIDRINKLLDQGHEVHYWTARGGNSGADWSDFTRTQLASWGCRYTTVNFKKPVYDIWIDDKAINSETYFESPSHR